MTIDLDELSEELLIARGAYATVRSAHEDSKKELQILCGALSSLSAQILRKMQPDNDAEPGNVNDMLSSCRMTIGRIELLTVQIAQIAKQRSELKIKAWRK